LEINNVLTFSNHRIYHQLHFTSVNKSRFKKLINNRRKLSITQSKSHAISSTLSIYTSDSQWRQKINSPRSNFLGIKIQASENKNHIHLFFSKELSENKLFLIDNKIKVIYEKRFSPSMIKVVSTIDWDIFKQKILLNCSDMKAQIIFNSIKRRTKNKSNKIKTSSTSNQRICSNCFHYYTVKKYCSLYKLHVKPSNTCKRFFRQDPIQIYKGGRFSPR